MKSTVRKTLALMLALMLALPTFVLADDAAVMLDANGQTMANELALDDDLALDGDLVLDGLSLELTQPQAPTGDLELSPQGPAEGGDGGAAGQPGTSEAGAPEETPVELGDAAQSIEDEIPVAQPLTPPNYAVDAALEGENVTDPAMMANDGEQTAWKELSGKFGSDSLQTIDLDKDCIALETDTRLMRSSAEPLVLNLNNFTIDRNLKENDPKTDGNVIYIWNYADKELTINGPGTITGGNIVGRQQQGEETTYGYGGGIAVVGGSTLKLNEAVEITGNRTSPLNSSGCGGGVYLGTKYSGSINKLIMNDKSALISNISDGFGGGVFLDKFAELEMNDGASISGNNAQEGGGVVVCQSASFNMKGGSITGNHAKEKNKGYGGGVSVREGSTFTMEKGEITGNHADGNYSDDRGGGGVYVGGTFTMTGGTIEGNYADSADGNGGGVYVEGTFKIGKDFQKSTIKITGNKKGDAANNVYLPAGKTINVEGKLSEDSKIGVTTEKKPNDTNGYIPITDHFAQDFDGEGKVFQSDDSQYEVGVIKKDDDSKTLGLGLIIVHKAEDVSVPYDGEDQGLKVNVTVPSESDQTVVKYKNAETGQYDQTTSPTFKKVGIHTVAYEVSNSDSVTKKYCFPAKGKGTVTIKPVVSIEGWTYGETPNDPKVAEASLPSDASLAYEYFTDEACTKKTTTSADGASAAGDRPKYAGIYYVVATVTVNGDKIQSNPAEFTIARAQATVTAADKSKTYGATDPELEATVSGLVKGDKIDYELSRAEGEDVGKYKITPAGDATQGNYKVTFKTGTLEITVKGLDNDTDGDGSEDADSNVIIALDPAEYTYDGTAKEPAVTVTDKDTKKTVPEKEYRVAYSDNVNAGTAKVTISDADGGNYVVRGVKTFAIKKAAMKVSAEGYKGQYDGQAHGITVTVTEPNTGYAVKYGAAEGVYDSDSLTYTDAGNYTVYYQVTAENYETVTGSATVEITPRGLDNDTDGDGSEDADSNVIIALDPAEYTYDGTAKEPAVTVTDKDTNQKVPEKEYKVAYSDNVNAGTAKVTIKDADGGNYAVNGVKTFAIKKAAMTVAAEDYKGEYDGQAHGITVTVTAPKTGYAVKYGEKEGTYDKDSLTYTDAGNYTVYYQVTAENYETVTGSATVEITAKDDKFTIELGKSEYTYNGEGKRPSVTVKYDGKVVPATEYKVTYSNNKHAGTAMVTISDVSGGQYTVSGNKTFTILPKTVALKWKSTAFVYDGDDHVPTAKAMGLVKKDKCKVSVSGAATEAGNHTARATKLSNPDYALPKNATKVFVISSRGSGGSGGSGSGNTRFVAEKKIGTEGIGTVTYDGKAQEPKFAVKCVIGKSNGVASNTVLTVPASEYRVTYHNNVNAGTATVEVTDVPGGNYVVNFRTEFTIARRKVTVTADDQRAETVDGVKTGLNAVRVKGLAKGHTLESVKLGIDIKMGAKKGEIIPGKARIVDAEGNDVTKNYSVSYKPGQLTVTNPRADFMLLAEMKTCGDRALRVSWTRVAGADGYEVTFVKEDCSFGKAEVVPVYHGNSWKFTDLKKNTAYKAYVRAWKNGKNGRSYIGKRSPVVCAITGDVRKDKTNADSVRVNASQLKLNVGERAKVEASVKGVKCGKNVMRCEHALLRWFSSDTQVATVNASGEIRAVGAGGCTVYAVAANGVRAAVKVKVAQ